tara:strand:+ start:2510 stop:3151 length:642 start_codon:yes stop_codon:yes gene_type:complete
MAVLEYNKPIPGSSLTSHKVGERMWERPPEVASVEDALTFYMQRLSNDDIIDDFMTAIESGIAIKPLVKGLYMSHVLRGIHSLDIGILIAPALSEFFAAIARSYDIKYKLSNRDYEKESEEKENAKLVMLIQAVADKAEDEGTADEGTALLSGIADFLEGDMSAQEQSETMEEMPPKSEELQQAEEPMEEGMPVADMTEPSVAPEGAGLMTKG